MIPTAMTLKILLPTEVFTHEPGVKRLVVETQEGSFGLLPGRLDCTAALVPGILTYETESGSTVYVAVDEGVLVKAGPNVSLSVRRALRGTDLSTLHDAVNQQFLTLDADEKNVRRVLAKMESGFVRRFAQFEQETRR
jgi:F-type H+-transporting ATPase subunit epsilon